MSPVAKLIASTAMQLPILRNALSPVYKQYFYSASGHRRLFRGIYGNFSAAMKAIPPDRLIGFDNASSAGRVSHVRNVLSPYDYPVLFWLQRLLKPGTMLFDWGGNVGISYYAFRRHLIYPDGLNWIVNDVPAVIDFAQHTAAEEEVKGLSFTSSFDRLSSADILLSAGAMQFIEAPFRLLRTVEFLPSHVLLNKISIYDRPHAVTLQNMGTSICPYHLFNRTEFIEEFRALGYELIDSWPNPGLGCVIPFYPDHSIGAFCGFYFRSAAGRLKSSS